MVDNRNLFPQHGQTEIVGHVVRLQKGRERFLGLAICELLHYQQQQFGQQHRLQRVIFRGFNIFGAHFRGGLTGYISNGLSFGPRL